METNQITLHDWQAQAWRSKSRFIMFCAGVQSGKTTFGAVWIINESVKHGPGDYLIIAPTYKILQQSTMQKFHEMAPRGWGVFNKAESTFRTRDGRVFFLRSADKPESIEGITAKAIWADEASLMKPMIWVMMQGRVSRTQGRILMTFTPISLNWIYHEIENDKARKKEAKRNGEDPRSVSDIDFIRFASVDSPYFPKEEFERARRTMPAHAFQLRYEGIFGKPEGLVYPDFQDHMIVDSFAIPREWQIVGGMDFGQFNPFVALKGALEPRDDVLYVYDEYYMARKTYDEHKHYLSDGLTYFADPSGAQDIEELRARDFDIQAANNDVSTGLNAVTERIKTNRLKVFKNCVNTLDEFSLYQWERNQTTGEWRDKPLKQNDHCMDALRYLVMGIEGWGEARGIEWI